MKMLKLSNGKTIKIFELKMNEVFSILNKVQDGNEEIVIRESLPMLCDMPLDEIIELPASEIEKIMDEVKHKNKAFINICRNMRQDLWLDQLLTTFSAALMKVLSDKYYPDLMKQAREVLNKNAG